MPDWLERIVIGLISGGFVAAVMRGWVSVKVAAAKGRVTDAQIELAQSEQAHRGEMEKTKDKRSADKERRDAEIAGMQRNMRWLENERDRMEKKLEDRETEHVSKWAHQEEINRGLINEHTACLHERQSLQEAVNEATNSNKCLTESNNRLVEQVQALRTENHVLMERVAALERRKGDASGV